MLDIIRVSSSKPPKTGFLMTWLNLLSNTVIWNGGSFGNTGNRRVASWQNQQNDCVHSEDSRKLGSLATHWAHSEESDQTGRMPRLIRVFAGRTCYFVGCVMRRRRRSRLDWICSWKIMEIVTCLTSHWCSVVPPHERKGTRTFLRFGLDRVSLLVFYCTSTRSEKHADLFSFGLDRMSLSVFCCTSHEMKSTRTFLRFGLDRVSLSVFYCTSHERKGTCTFLRFGLDRVSLSVFCCTSTRNEKAHVHFFTLV